MVNIGGLTSHTATTASNSFLWLIPQNTQAQDKLPFNDCSEFVDWLAGLANDTAQRNSRLNMLGAAAGLGARMMYIARFQYDSYSTNGFSGFRDELTRGGQNRGVYTHVIGNAGAVLAGSSAIIAGNHLKDMAQSKWEMSVKEQKGRRNRLEI